MSLHDVPAAALVRTDALEDAVGLEPGNLLIHRPSGDAYPPGSSRHRQRTVLGSHRNAFLPTICGFLPTFFKSSFPRILGTLPWTSEIHLAKR